MDSNTGMDQFGTNNANTVLVPRRDLYEIDPQVGKIIIEIVRGITWKKALIVAGVIVAAGIICYMLCAAGLGL